MIRAGTFEEIESTVSRNESSLSSSVWKIRIFSDSLDPLNAFIRICKQSERFLAITSYNKLESIALYKIIKERITLRLVQCQFFFFSVFQDLIISSIKKANVIPSDDKQVLGFETSSRCEVFLYQNRGAFDVHWVARFSE